MASMAKTPKKPGKAKPAAPPSEEMTGGEFARWRAAFDKTQAEFAKELGLGHRTVIRYEGTAFTSALIPLAHAKLVRCLAREQGITLPK